MGGSQEVDDERGDWWVRGLREGYAAIAAALDPAALGGVVYLGPNHPAAVLVGPKTPRMLHNDAQSAP